MHRVRDSQRRRLYQAERPVFEGHPKADAQMRITGFTSFVKKEQTTARWERQWKKYNPDAPSIPVVTGREGRGHATASFNHNKFEIRVPTRQNGAWARRKWVALHELAHALTYQSRPAHGWEFASAYLDLVRGSLGQELHDKLKASFRAHGVRFRPKRVVNLSPAQREERRQRMAAVRAKRKPKPMPTGIDDVIGQWFSLPE